MIRTMTFVATLLCTGNAVAQTPAWMKAGPGQEETAISCGVCHTLNYIRMNSRFIKPDVWKAEVDKMRVAFGAPIDDDTAAAILAYLNRNFAASP